MPAAIVRADYDRLTVTAAVFSQQAQAARQTLLQLDRHLATLQGGDWLGQGAQAFYAEMNAQILPTMNRLVRALEAAADTTRQVSQVAQQAENEAAACFKLNGSGGNGAGATIAAAAASLGTASGGSAVAEPAAGAPAAGAAALFGGKPEPGGNSNPAAKPKTGASEPIAPKVKNWQDSEGIRAYEVYLAQYREYLQEQAKAWNWKDIEGRLEQQLATGKRLTEFYDKHVGPLNLEYLIKLRRGISDPDLHDRLTTRNLEYANMRNKAHAEAFAASRRAHELLREYDTAARKGGYTQAEADSIRKRIDQMSRLEDWYVDPWAKWEKPYQDWLEKVKNEK